MQKCAKQKIQYNVKRITRRLQRSRSPILFFSLSLNLSIRFIAQCKHSKIFWWCLAFLCPTTTLSKFRDRRHVRSACWPCWVICQVCSIYIYLRLVLAINCSMSASWRLQYLFALLVISRRSTSLSLSDSRSLSLSSARIGDPLDSHVDVDVHVALSHETSARNLAQFLVGVWY